MKNYRFFCSLRELIWYAPLWYWAQGHSTSWIFMHYALCNACWLHYIIGQTLPLPSCILVISLCFLQHSFLYWYMVVMWLTVKMSVKYISYPYVWWGVKNSEFWFLFVKTIEKIIRLCSVLIFFWVVVLKIWAFFTYFI